MRESRIDTARPGHRLVSHDSLGTLKLHGSPGFVWFHGHGSAKGRVSANHSRLLRLLSKTAEDAADAAGFGRRALPRLVLLGGSGKTIEAGKLFRDVALARLWQTPNSSLTLESLAKALRANSGWSYPPFNIKPFCHPGSAIQAEPAPLEFDLDNYICGGSGLGHLAVYRSLLSVSSLMRLPGGARQSEPVASVDETRSGLELVLANLLRRLSQLNPAEMVQKVMHLISLWRRADPARFARMLSAQIRLGQLWAAFRPPKPPGQLMMSSSHVTRGPDATRTNQQSWLSAASLALT